MNTKTYLISTTLSFCYCWTWQYKLYLAMPKFSPWRICSAATPFNFLLECLRKHSKKYNLTKKTWEIHVMMDYKSDKAYLFLEGSSNGYLNLMVVFSDYRENYISSILSELKQWAFFRINCLLSNPIFLTFITAYSCPFQIAFTIRKAVLN